MALFPFSQLRFVSKRIPYGVQYSQDQVYGNKVSVNFLLDQWLRFTSVLL